METLRDLHVVRGLRARPELRAAADDQAGDATSDVLGQMTGHFSVFNDFYRIQSWWEGDFLEQIAPGTFRKTMAERRDQIVVAFDHGFDPQIGDKVLGPIDDLREDGTGAAYDVALLDTSYNRDLLPALKRGLYGASFRFQVIKDEWDDEPGVSDHNPDGIPERTIKEVRLFEFGPVTYPASPAATAGMRSISMTDAYYDHLKDREPATVENLRSRAHDLRTRRSAPAGLSEATGQGPAAAGSTGSEPAPEATRTGLTPRERRALLHPILRTEQ
jgi:HK97 family phage prohead protease